MLRTTLLAFASALDPWYFEREDDEPKEGPLLAALGDRRFDSLVILCRAARRDAAERTARAIRDRPARVPTEIQEVVINDASNHTEVFGALRIVMRRLRARLADTEFSILLGDDPAEIHACWLLLVASGEVEAKLFNFRKTGSRGQRSPRVLREIRWKDPLVSLSPSTLALMAPKRGELYDEASVIQAGGASQHLFVARSVEIATQLAPGNTPILLQAEPGTQKTLFAALLHQLSGRDGPLIVFNCATVPEEFAEKALFGEAEGEEAGPGKLQQAAGGTLVLIKFQKLPERVQLAVMRAVEDGEISRVGAKARERLTARILATTDLDLSQEVTRGRFNAEVFRRLRAGLVRLPPLRERPSDLALLIRDEMQRANHQQPRPKRLTPEAMAKLESHHWPSNISELRRVVEHAFVNAQGSVIGPDDIEFDLSTNLENHFAPAPPRIRKGFSIEAYLRNVKRELVQIALQKSNGNQSQAARMLGITPQAVNKFLQVQRSARRG
jgi:transcriptional regulator of acetoin/glycerol metabolism